MLLKPSIPYLDYMVRKSYIIEKLCVNKDKPEMQCNGECHLNEQILKESGQSAEDNIPFPSPRVQKKLQDFLILRTANENELPEQTLAGALFSVLYSFQFVPSIFHPPMQGSLAPNLELFLA